MICFPVGKKAEWSDKVRAAIKNVKEQYFVMLLEDFFVGEKIDEQAVCELINYMKTRKLGYVKLCENNEAIHHRQQKYEKGYPFEVIYKDQKYGISLQPSIWAKKMLTEIVGEKSYNAWEFEAERLKEVNNQKHEIMTEAIFDPRNILHIKHGAI